MSINSGQQDSRTASPVNSSVLQESSPGSQLVCVWIGGSSRGDYMGLLVLISKVILEKEEASDRYDLTTSEHRLILCIDLHVHAF